MHDQPKLLYEIPLDSKTIYLQMNGERYLIRQFLRTNDSGLKKRYSGGEIQSGDIAVISRRGKSVEVTLTIESILTEFATDPPPPKKSSPRRRA